MEVLEASTASQLAEAKALIVAYAAEVGVDLGFQGYEEELARFPGEFSPPSGAVLLALEGTDPVGVVALRRFHGPVAEMKRLYVRPRARSHGIGRALGKAVVEKAAALGYERIRLDTLPTMAAAIELYASLGFKEIPAYRFNPFAGARYMELALWPRHRS